MQTSERMGHGTGIPSTWRGRAVMVEYTGADGSEAHTGGVLADSLPVGLLLNIEATRTLIPWQRIALVELVNG